MKNPVAMERETLDEIANAIRAKDKTTSPIIGNDFPWRIRTIPTATVEGGGIIVRVYAPIGSVVTVAKDDVFYSGTEEAGVWDFIVPEYGTYLVSARLSESERQLSVDVNPTEVDFVFNNTFGVCWDYSNPSTALERLQPDTDPYGYVNTWIYKEPQGAIGTDGGSSPFDVYLPWNGMEQYNILPDNTIIKRGEEGFSQTENDTMVYIPEFYYTVIDVPSESKRYWYVCSGERDGFEKHPGSGLYVARYSSGNGYVSKSNTAPISNITCTQARDGSRKKGNNWWQLDYATLCAIQILYLVEFSNWDSKSMIGYGISGYGDLNNQKVHNNGETDSMTYHTGTVDGEFQKSAIQYRWIENILGNISEYTDGISTNNNRLVYICLNRENFNSTSLTGYISSNIAFPSPHGFITSLGYSNAFKWAFLCNKDSGSDSTYIPEQHIVGINNAINSVVCCGTAHGKSANGIFYLRTFYNNNNMANIGARLIYDPTEEESK